MSVCSASADAVSSGLGLRGWGLGAGGWVPSSEALLASSSWPGDYGLSFVGTETPFRNSDATIYHG